MRKAKASYNLEQYDVAARCLEEALEVAPGNKEVPSLAEGRYTRHAHHARYGRYVRYVWVLSLRGRVPLRPSHPSRAGALAEGRVPRRWHRPFGHRPDPNGAFGALLAAGGARQTQGHRDRGGGHPETDADAAPGHPSPNPSPKRNVTLRSTLLQPLKLKQAVIPVTPVTFVTQALKLKQDEEGGAMGGRQYESAPNYDAQVF